VDFKCIFLFLFIYKESFLSLIEVKLGGGKMKYLTATMVLGLIAIFSIGLVSAYRGNYGEVGPMHSTERCSAMTEIFESGDYGAWRAQMEGRNSKVLQLVNEENFPIFVQARAAAKEGNLELSKQLRAELGLGQKSEQLRAELGQNNGNKQGKGLGQGGMRQFRNK
jgi:hypothetical protein